MAKFEKHSEMLLATAVCVSMILFIRLAQVEQALEPTVTPILKSTQKLRKSTIKLLRHRMLKTC
jgi:hypothetical protein